MKTKSLLKVLFFALLMGITGLIKLNAQTFIVGDLEYYCNDYVSVTLCGHVDGHNATGELNIPESVMYYGTNYSVTIIDNEAFYECSGLTGTLIIPNSVIEIRYDAFNGCSGFTGSLIIPNTVTNIAANAFWGCEGLTSISIPSSVTTIGGDAFTFCPGIASIFVDTGNSVYDSRNNCNAIIKTADNELITGCKNTVIPNTVTSIGDYAFRMCYGLTNITIPNSVTSIGVFAFESCMSLTSIEIPNSVDSIRFGAFAECTNLTSITIPYSVTSIDLAFPFCTALAEIIVDNENPVYDSRNNCNAIIKTEDNELVVGCRNTIIPSTVTSIGNSAFYGCSGLSNITIPNSVTTIGDYAFGHCSGSNVTLSIGNSVEHIGFCAFYNFSNFARIEILATTPPVLDNGAFDEFSCSTLIVPCGCVSAYENSAWHNYFPNIIEDCSDVAELDANSVSIYPNPTSEIVKIEAENIRNVNIYNVLGEQLYNSPVSGNVFEYDFSNYEAGVYLVRIETSQGIVTKRVMVKC